MQLPPKAEIKLTALRALHFLQAVYWILAVFFSDQKALAIVPVALDLHYGRQVLPSGATPRGAPAWANSAEPLAEARLSVAAAYLAARTEGKRHDRVLLANVQGRELSERGTQQIPAHDSLLCRPAQ